MYVHRSNRVEVLATALAEVVARPLANPLAAETIVVQSRGMERWLSIRLASCFGVWAGARFPFPRAFVEEILDRVLDEGAAEGTRSARPAHAFTREGLTLRVARLLLAHRQDPRFSAVARYLAHDAGAHKVVGLARHVADLFDQYVAYRPELVLAWAGSGLGRGRGTAAAVAPGAAQEAREWQAVLWADLVAELGEDHLAARAARFRERWPAVARVPEAVPERVSVFGVTSMPPVYLEVLECLSRRVEVHLFCLSSSREHATEIRSRREILRELLRAGSTSEAELHLTEGNPLLASLGRLEREFQQQLEVNASYLEDDRDLYVDPGTEHALHALQSDVLHLRHRGPGREVPPLVLAPRDRSVEVHVCHAPVREVEVLREQLRALFEEDPTLQPHDVIVMAPDIEAYAPLIEATFGRDRHDPNGIPYSISDRSPRAASAVVAAVLTVLDVLRGRFTASEVVDLLHHAPVRERFAITEEELPLLTRWIREANVRWGVDGADRASRGQPDHDANTWRFGLRRLLLGHAMPGDRRELFAGTLPYDDVEGSAAAALGRLAALCDELFRWRESLAAERPIADWVAPLDLLVTRTLEVKGPAGWELQVVRDALRTLGERAATSGFTLPVSLDLMEVLLGEELDAEQSARAFLAGGVTFCALLPMRSVPFRVVCLLGMNDGTFPRIERRIGFDLIAAQRRAGDRSLRDEDRYLFLEAVLSARERLMVTYVGRSIQDNASLPPSVVLGELLDVLRDSFAPVAASSAQGRLDLGEVPASALDQLVVEHPLQYFSPLYFQGRGKLVSYDAAAAQGAAALVQKRDVLPRFVRAPLPELPPDPGVTTRSVALEDLAAFLENPARSLLRGRLGLDLEDRSELVPDREPLRFDGLERWSVATELLEAAVTEGVEVAASTTRDAVAAQGVLPPGTAGRCHYDDLVPEVEALAEVARRHASGPRLPAVELDLEVAGVRLHGVLDRVWPTAQVYFTYSRVQAKRELGAWVHHLALSAAAARPAPAGLPRTTVLVGRGARGGVEEVVFEPLDAAAARERLAELVALYRLGQCVPLPFFPAAARAFVECRAQHLAKHPDAADDALRHALAAAREAYDPPDFNRGFGDLDDAYVARLYADVDPLAPDFQPTLEAPPPELLPPPFVVLAQRIFGPLLGATGGAA